MLVENDDSIAGQLAKARAAFLAAKTALQVSEEKNQQLEMQMSDLITAREEETQELKALREGNAYLKERGLKLRESNALLKGRVTQLGDSNNLLKEQEAELQKSNALLKEQETKLRERNVVLKEQETKLLEMISVMKKVFSKAHHKSKEERETASAMSEERDVLLEENARLRSMQGRSDVRKNAGVLATSLEAARAQVSEFRRAQMKSEKTIQKLKAEVRELRQAAPELQHVPVSFNDRENKLAVLGRKAAKRLVVTNKKVPDTRDLEVESGPKDTESSGSERDSYSTDDSDIDTKVLIYEEVANVRNFTRNFCSGAY